MLASRVPSTVSYAITGCQHRMLVPHRQCGDDLHLPCPHVASVSSLSPQNPDIVLVHYLNVPAIEDCGKPCGPILCSINTDKKEWAKWTKEELIGQLKPMCEYFPVPHPASIAPSCAPASMAQVGLGESAGRPVLLRHGDTVGLALMASPLVPTVTYSFHTEVKAQTYKLRAR